MPDFWIFFKVGLDHVLSLNAYDHLLFISVLVAPYIFKDWKKLLVLVSFFTLGHTLSLFLSVFKIITAQVPLVEVLILCTILIGAVFNLFVSSKGTNKGGITFISGVTLLFGIIHGLGFSNYFNSLLPGSAADKFVPLLEFALGIESAQIIVVVVVLILSFIAQTLLRFNKRDFTLILSSFAIGVVVPLLLDHPFWEK
jgi:hypothetical protein